MVKQPVAPQHNSRKRPTTRVVTLDAPGTEEAVRLFERISQEEGWQPDGELRAHVGRSVYFGLWAEGGTDDPAPQLIGALQLVRPDASGQLPSQRVWPELPINSEAGIAHIAHIAVLAVRADWRGKAGGLFWQLTAAMWNYCVRSGIRELWLEATPRTKSCYERFGWPLRVRGDLRDHWGEPCYPCSLDVREVAGSLAERAVLSTSYRQVLAAMVGDAVCEDARTVTARTAC